MHPDHSNSRNEKSPFAGSAVARSHAGTPTASSIDLRKTSLHASTTSIHSRTSASDLREELKDRIWNSVVVGGKVVGNAAAAAVAVVAIGQVVFAARGINPFNYFHDHPALSHISTIAHLGVMFLAASAGFGLWRFRQNNETIQNKTKELLHASAAQDSSADLLKLRLEPLRQHAERVNREYPVAAGPKVSALIQAMEGLHLDPGSLAGKNSADKTVEAKLDRFTAALQAVTADPTLSKTPPPRIDTSALVRDARKFDQNFREWEKLHDELYTLLPRINLPQASGQASSIASDLAAQLKSPNLERWTDITNRAVQLEANSRDIPLSRASRTLLEGGVETLQRFPADASPREMQETAAALAPWFTRIARKIIDADPHTDKFELLRFQLNGKIAEYARRYPNLSARASVAGIIGAVSYWITCAESLETILPSGNPHDSGMVGLKLLKHVLPFVMQAGAVFAAGAVNNKFRPYITWASLELSKMTLTAMAPFAWAYQEGQELFGKIWERAEKKAVGNIYKRQ